MTTSDTGTISPDPAEQRMRDILARQDLSPQNMLAALREAGLAPPDYGLKERTLEPTDLVGMTAHAAPIVHLEPTDLGGVTPHAAPIVHLEPNAPVATDGATGQSFAGAWDTMVGTGPP